MSHLILPSREIWTRQPQEAVEVDLSSKPVFVMLGSEIHDVLNNIRLTQVNGSHLSKIIPAPPGACIAPGGGAPYASGLKFIAPSAFILSVGATLVWIGAITQADATYSVIASRWSNFTDSANYAGQWRVEISPSNELRLALRDDGGVTSVLNSGLTVTPNRVAMIKIRMLPGSIEFTTNSQSSVVATSAAQTNTGGTGNTVAITVGTTGGGGYNAHQYSRCALLYGVLGSAPKNPWQIFAPRETRLFVPLSAGGGSTLNASATGLSTASGTATLATQVALSAIGVALADGTATAAVQIPLSAAGITVAAGSANPQATITLSAAGLAQAAGQAGLSASVLLQAAGAAQASGNAPLAAQLAALATGAAQATGTANLTGGAPGELNASGQAQADGSAVLSVTIGVSATGGDVASGSANLTGGAPGQITATGGAQADGSAVASATVALTAAGFVSAMGAGVWSVTVPLSAFGGAVTSGGAHLTELGNIVFTRAPRGSGPTLIAQSGRRIVQSNQTRPANTGGRRLG